MKKSNSNSGFTLIDWDELKKMCDIVEESAEINKKKKLTYADILVISYIKGFGSNGEDSSRRPVRLKLLQRIWIHPF